MKCELVYTNLNPTVLNVPKCVLPPNGKFDHHLQSTVGDNLIELAGRICYESLKSPKTRATDEYHKHINDVNHGSTQEHFVINLGIDFPINLYSQVYRTFCNRPGAFIVKDLNGPGFIVTANIRTINEWKESQCRVANSIGYFLKRKAQELCPFAFNKSVISYEHDKGYIEIYQPYQLDADHQKWFSFYIGDVSRGLTHELCRHKYQTAFSQRSTRYVDESESVWAWHPLIQKYESEVMSCLHNNKCSKLDNLENSAKSQYKLLVNLLENKLVLDGIDRFTARKQARGAARGILGNALSTELLFSCSLWELRNILRQRASRHADAEIRLLANKMYELTKGHFPEATKHECPDKIGYELQGL